MTRKNSGSLMMESLVAMALVVVGLFGIFNLIYVSIGADSLAVHKLQATYLAAEGVEIIKNYIDLEGYTNFVGTVASGTYQVAYEDNGPIGGPQRVCQLPDGSFSQDPQWCGNPVNKAVKTVFQRSVTITYPNSSTTDVSSAVTWTEKGQNQSVILEDRFYE